MAETNPKWSKRAQDSAATNATTCHKCCWACLRQCSWCVGPTHRTITDNIRSRFGLRQVTLGIGPLHPRLHKTRLIADTLNHYFGSTVSSTCHRWSSLARLCRYSTPCTRQVCHRNGLAHRGTRRLKRSRLPKKRAAGERWKLQ